MSKILKAAIKLSTAELDILSYALGWPTAEQIKKTKKIGRVRWRDPHRNSSVGPQDRTLDALVFRGILNGPRNYEFVEGAFAYTVTPLGIAATRARLKAEIEEVRYFQEVES